MRHAGLILALLAAAACRRSEPRGEESELIAFVVRTEPPGATVRVGRIDRAWTTPCEIAHPSLRRGNHDVTVSLAGHDPVVRRVGYDGHVPVQLDLKLRAQVPPPPAPVPPPAPPAQGQLTIRGSGEKIRVRAGGQVVAEFATKAGESVQLPLPREKVAVEFLDEKGTVASSVELSPDAAAAVVLPPDGERVGRIQAVHRSYGIFVRLDPGLAIEPGEEIVIVREGREVGRTRVLRVVAADPRYPDGAAQVSSEGSPVQKGDEVRRPR
jgi:hypothetical protein